MKITKSHLRQLIKEEFGRLVEMTPMSYKPSMYDDDPRFDDEALGATSSDPTWTEMLDDDQTDDPSWNNVLDGDDNDDFPRFDDEDFDEDAFDPEEADYERPLRAGYGGV